MKKTNSKTNSWFWISILALVLFLIAPGQTVQAADEIIIGYSGPLSGGAAKFGFNIQWGLGVSCG